MWMWTALGRLDERLETVWREKRSGTVCEGKPVAWIRPSEDLARLRQTVSVTKYVSTRMQALACPPMQSARRARTFAGVFVIGRRDFCAVDGTG